MGGLSAAFRALPDRQRRALLRRELQGYSYDEIGAELGASRASVAALVHRARLAVADTLRDARRGVAALVPIPALLRAPFESASIAGVAVAGTTVVAVAHLALLPSPFSPAPPARSATEVSAAVGAAHLVASTVRARPVAGRASEPARDVSRRSPSPHDTAGPVRSYEGVSVFGMAALPTGPTFSPLPQTPLQPPPIEEPAAGPTTPEEPQPGVSLVADPQAPVPEDEEEQTEQTEEPTPAPGRGGAIAPGKQPKGSKGRSAYAPGQAGKHEKSHPPNAPGGGSASGSSDAGQAPAETPQPPLQAEEGAPGNADPQGGAQAPDEPGQAGGQQGGQANGGGQEKGAGEENGKRNGGSQEQGGGLPGGRAP